MVTATRNIVYFSDLLAVKNVNLRLFKQKLLYVALSDLHKLKSFTITEIGGLRRVRSLKKCQICPF